MRSLFLLSRILSSRVVLLSIKDTKSQLVSVNVLGSVRNNSSSSILRCLKSFGVRKEDLYSYPELFEIPKKELSEKTKFLNGKLTNGDDILSIVLLPMRDIVKYLEIKQNKEKISALTNILKCTESEACQLFIKHGFLLRSKMSTVQEKVNIMLEGGVTLEDMKRDLWVITYTREHIRSRIHAVKKQNIYPIKPWMLRCKEQVLYRAKSNKEENLLAMAPHASSKEYICDRLGLSHAQFLNFVSKCPPVARVQVTKLKELIDFLLYEGFTKEQICQTPRILCHSVHTIKDRLVSLRENYFRPQTLSTLCKNKKTFDSLVLKLKMDSRKEPR